MDEFSGGRDSTAGRTSLGRGRPTEEVRPPRPLLSEVPPWSLPKLGPLRELGFSRLPCTRVRTGSKLEPELELEPEPKLHCHLLFYK